MNQTMMEHHQINAAILKWPKPGWNSHKPAISEVGKTPGKTHGVEHYDRWVLRLLGRLTVQSETSPHFIAAQKIHVHEADLHNFTKIYT